MTDSSKTSCRVSLVIFVDTTGFNIFQKFNGIKEAVGFDTLLQKYTGLIFYESRPKLASGLYSSHTPSADDAKSYKITLEKAIRDNNPDLYKITLENAIHAMLAALTDEASIDALKNGGFDVQPEPQVFIVGSSNTIAPGLALKTVHKVLARPDPSITRTQVYSILSGPAVPVRSPTTGEKKEGATLNSNVQQAAVTFSYLYPYTTTQTQEKAFYDAASALFTLINTGIASQQPFQRLIQYSAQKTGTLRTYFLTFPGREMRSYCANQLTSDLLDKWMPEETFIVALQDMKNATKPVPSPDTTTGAISVPEASLAQELQRVIPDYLLADNLDTGTFDKFCTFKSIHSLYKKNSNPDEAWTAFLTRISQEELNAWKQKAQEELEKTKARVLPKIGEEVILPTLVQSSGVQHVRLADLLHQQLEKIRGTDNTSIASANLGQYNETVLRTLEKQAGQATEHMPSLSTLLIAVILALVILYFLIFAQTSSLTATPLMWTGILIAFPAMGFFLLQRQRVRKVQKQLIEQTRQKILDEAETFKKGQTDQFIKALSNDLSDRLKDIRNWFESKKDYFKKEADSEFETLCETLTASPHHHICDHKLLLKNELDNEILREYYKGQIRTRINVNASGNIPTGGDISHRQLTLYTELFNSFLSARPKEKSGNESPEVPIDKNELSDKPLNFVTSIIDEYQGNDDLKNVPEYLYSTLDKKHVWEQLLNTLLKTSIAGSSTLPLVFICGCGPDMKAIQKRIRTLNAYQRLTVVPVRTRIINQYWFFVAALFCDDCGPLNAGPIAPPVESSHLYISAKG
jgi:hypothetical protein